VTTLGEITSKDGARTEIQELDSISRVVQEGKTKAIEIRFEKLPYFKSKILKGDAAAIILDGVKIVQKK
jgi:hypothetical protein